LGGASDMEILSDNNYYLSNLYESSLGEDDKKALGIYYTPKYIIDYIVKKILYNHDFIKNPCPKILDISCGCGNFLLEVYDVLYEIFEKHKFELKIEDIHNHIITNCIYGVDIDLNAIEVLKYSLNNKCIDSSIDNLNIYCFDSLSNEGIDENIKKIFKNDNFDYIIGNPPYIGHKSLDINYKKWLLKAYPEVYRDKSDIYFCFYKRIIDLLKQNGIASIITPRYFIESQSGKMLRKYILNNVNIKEIIDFNGVNVFKNVSVASCIFTMEKTRNKNAKVDIYKLNNYGIDFNDIEDINVKLKNENEFIKISLNQSDMKDDWVIDKRENMFLYSKIEEYCNYKLKDICISFQGIITGCDKAFVINDEDVKELAIEEDILKKWIKSKNIKKYFIENNSLELIYSNDIDDCSKYLNSINYINEYRQKLENRRECRKNIRRWYQLQWGREKSMFERKKIMYPYKSKENRFAIDINNSYCSADVYSFYIKDEYLDEFSYEYIVGLLNSSIYDTYFKIFAKKMGKDLYDYYPNKVMKISIFKDYNYESIEILSKEIIKMSKNDNKSSKEIITLQNKIDELIKDSLKLNSLI
jgi:adenine-specific DNA-methyltransferase